MKKAHQEGRHPGWKHINENPGLSYPERVFKKILSSLNYYNVLDIHEHFSYGKYFMDFAIVDLKVDIEIDGQQHFRTKKAITHDRIRDEYLESNDWKIYRIAWLELVHKQDTTIDEFKKWISQISESDSRRYNIEDVKYLVKNPPVYGSRDLYFNEVRKTGDLKYRDKILQAISSDIDFSKFGWVNKVSKMTGIKHQKVHIWMKRIAPEFYEKECFKRSSSSIG